MNSSPSLEQFWVVKKTLFSKRKDWFFGLDLIHFCSVFSMLRRKFTFAPIPPRVNLVSTLWKMDTPSPFRLFKNCSNLLCLLVMSRSNLWILSLICFNLWLLDICFWLLVLFASTKTHALYPKTSFLECLREIFEARVSNKFWRGRENLDNRNSDYRICLQILCLILLFGLLFCFCFCCCVFLLEMESED